MKIETSHENYKYDQSHPLYYQQGAASYFVNNRTRQVHDGWSHPGSGTFCLWHNGLSHKKSAVTKQASDGTWDEANRIWLGKEAMRECTS